MKRFCHASEALQSNLQRKADSTVAVADNKMVEQAQTALFSDVLRIVQVVTAMSGTKSMSIECRDFSFRSPLKEWLEKHRAEFERSFPGVKKRNWGAVASWAHAEGVTNARGGPVTRENLRQAWYRLTKTVPIISSDHVDKHSSRVRAIRPDASVADRSIDGISDISDAGFDDPETDNDFTPIRRKNRG